nr:hypothetical protein [Leifsonia sp. Leaf325]
MQGIPSNDEIQGEVDPIRRALLAGMQRMLLGQPRTPAGGALNVKTLAIESGVPRHHLYQTHPDLRDRFEFLRDHSSMPSATEATLQEQLARMKTELEELRNRHRESLDELRNWKALAETFGRAINVLQEELRREQIKSGRLAKKVANFETQNHPAPVVHIRPSRSGQ